MIGIYKIKNIVTGKIYIGSSINIEYRIKQHFKCLKGNYHKNNHLQLSFNKHKEESFIWELILECNKNELLKKETELILSNKSYDRNIGYNILINAEHSRLGVKHTEETKSKISVTQKGKKISKEHSEKVKKNLINGSYFTQEQKEICKIKKSKFKEQDVLNIIELYNNGKTQKEITELYKCSKTTTNKLFKELFKNNKLKKRKNGI